MRASQFVIENIDSDAVNELDSYIMNNEDLYRRRLCSTDEAIIPSTFYYMIPP